MSSGALFGNTGNRLGSTGGCKHLLEMRAGKMNLKDQMVYPDKRKGLLYLYRSSDSLMHFCWKDRTTGIVEDDLIIFPDECEYFRVHECTTGRAYLLHFKSSKRKMFFWLQEPKEDKDEEHCKKINALLNNLPISTQPSQETRQTLRSLLSNMSQTQLLEVFGNQFGNLSSILRSIRSGETGSNRGTGTGNGSGTATGTGNGSGTATGTNNGSSTGARSGTDTSTDSGNNGGSARTNLMPDLIRRTPAKSAKKSVRTPESPSNVATISPYPIAESIKTTKAHNSPSVPTQSIDQPTTSTNNTSTSGSSLATTSNPAPSGEIKLADFQNFLLKLIQKRQLEQKENEEMDSPRSVDLSTTLNAEILPSILNVPEALEALQSLLPKVDSVEPIEPQEALRLTLASPQFQQAVSQFSSAIESGQFGPILSQFNVNKGALTAASFGSMEAFLRALEKEASTYEKEDQATDLKKKDNNNDNKDDDKQMD